MSTKSEIIARSVATLKMLTQAREEREMAKRASAGTDRKKVWQLSEIARIERGPTGEFPSIFTAGYDGYLDGYRGQCS